eukprot:515549-Pyramimonas_sp.AAC.1
MAPARRQSGQVWVCTTCANPRDGNQWFNIADAVTCKLCKLHKGICYGGPKKPAAGEPPPASKQKDLANQVAQLQAELRRVRHVAPAGDADPGPVVGDAQGVDGKRTRITDSEGIM